MSRHHSFYRSPNGFSIPSRNCELYCTLSIVIIYILPDNGGLHNIFGTTDNAVMESFYRTLKRELVQDADYDNPEQARMDIFKYIETYYNTKRIHSALGWLSPIQFEIKNS